MKISSFVTFGALVALSAVSVAQEPRHSSMAIAISDMDGEHPLNFEISGNHPELDLQSMQEGENRSIIDDAGRTILVTREADGFRFDVDGKSVKMPAFDGEHHGAVFIGDAAIEDVDVHVMSDVTSHASTTTLSAHPMPGTMIMTDKPVDDATRQAIETLLQSAGNDGDVRFMDREGISGSISGYKVIRKEASLAQ